MTPPTAINLLAELWGHVPVLVSANISGVVVTGSVSNVLPDGDILLDWQDDHGRDQSTFVQIGDVESFEVE